MLRPTFCSQFQICSIWQCPSNPCFTHLCSSLGVPSSAMAPKTSTSSRLIPVSKISPDAFSPFGTVVQNPDKHGGVPQLQKAKANQGTATKWLDVTEMRSFYEMSSSRKCLVSLIYMDSCRGSAFLKKWMEFLEDNADLRYPDISTVTFDL